MSFQDAVALVLQCYRPYPALLGPSGEFVQPPVARSASAVSAHWQQLLVAQLHSAQLGDLPPPDVLQQEIIGHLEAALLAFRDVAAGLPKSIAATP